MSKRRYEVEKELNKLNRVLIRKEHEMKKLEREKAKLQQELNKALEMK